jgi:O-antigen ligase
MLIWAGVVAFLVYAADGLVPTLAGLAVLGLLLLLRPKLGLPLIAVALPFYQPGVAIGSKVFSLVEILTILTLLGWAANWFLGAVSGGGGVQRAGSVLREQVRSLATLDWAILALVIVGFTSLLWTAERHVALRELRVVILEAAVFYALLRIMVKDRRDLWLVVDGWVLGAAAIALIGLAQWLFGQNLIDADGVWRVRGFYGSPNNLALYLGRVLPTLVAIGAFATVRPGNRADSLRRWSYALAGVVLLASLVLTYSRGAWLVGVPASILFVAALRGRKVFLVVTAAAIVLAIMAVLVLGGGRLVSLLDTSEGTTFFRLQLWQSSAAMLADHPLTGVGLDNFLYEYRSTYALPTAWEELNLSHPHNLVLDFWLRLGLPGLAVLVWLLLGFFVKGLRTYSALLDGFDRLLILGLMGGMVNFVAHGLVDNAYFLVDLAYVFSLMLAVIQFQFNDGYGQAAAAGAAGKR